MPYNLCVDLLLLTEPPQGNAECPRRNGIFENAVSQLNIFLDVGRKVKEQKY
jgi:hypothetical protein